MSNNLDSLKLKQQLWEKEAVKQLLIILKNEIEHEITINSIEMKDENKPLIAEELRLVFDDLEQTLPQFMHIELVDRESIVRLNKHFNVTVVPTALQKDMSFELAKIARIYHSFGTNGHKPHFGTNYDGKPFYDFSSLSQSHSLLTREYRDTKTEFAKAMHEYIRSHEPEKPTPFNF